MDAIYLELIKGAISLAAAGLAAWFALWFYFRQKQYELIKQRYLDGGVDVVAGDLETALGVLSHNWARCLHVVKLYRDEKEHLDPRDLEKVLLETDISNFSRIAHHRLGSLVGSQIIWEVFQLALSFAMNQNGKIKEILETIRLKLKTSAIDAKPHDIVTAIFAELQNIDEESHKFAHLTRELYALGRMLEAEKLSFRDLAKFPSRPEARALVSRLESSFKTELAPHHEPAV